jgi:transcriptional regulator with XRE-family HTH domain
MKIATRTRSKVPLDVQKMERLRESLGLSQEQAAKACEFSGRSYWRDVVSGRRSNVTVETLEKIAKVLRVKPADLLK